MSPTSTGCSSPVLSTAGMKFLNDTKEVCYLTQIVIRLFEDTSQPVDNHRRFRIEILFSAGANATPLHMSESSRDNDTTRLHTGTLRAVGREGLTCKEVEDFFDSIISARGRKDKEKLDVSHKADTTVDSTKKEPGNLGTSSDADAILSDNTSRTPAVVGDGKSKTAKDVTFRSEDAQSEDNLEGCPLIPKKITISTACTTSEHQQARSHKLYSDDSEETIHTSNGAERSKSIEKRLQEKSIGGQECDFNDGKNKPDDSPPNQMSHRMFYRTVAAGTFLIGAGCLLMAMSLSGGRNQSRRRYTTR
jgi:hypothetical protein